MAFQVIVTGIGGQGVLFATRLLAHAALVSGQRVMGSETHGMSQRGGSVTSHLKIGSAASPLVRRGTTDLVLALSLDEAYRNLAFVRPEEGERRGGSVIVNTHVEFPTPAVSRVLSRYGVTTHHLDADAQALALGSVRAANLIIIGFACAVVNLPFSFDDLTRAVADQSPETYREANCLALKRGFELGTEGVTR